MVERLLRDLSVLWEFAWSTLKERKLHNVGGNWPALGDEDQSRKAIRDQTMGGFISPVGTSDRLPSRLSNEPEPFKLKSGLCSGFF